MLNQSTSSSREMLVFNCNWIITYLEPQSIFVLFLPKIILGKKKYCSNQLADPILPKLFHPSVLLFNCPKIAFKSYWKMQSFMNSYIKQLNLNKGKEYRTFKKLRLCCVTEAGVWKKVMLLFHSNKSKIKQRVSKVRAKEKTGKSLVHLELPINESKSCTETSSKMSPSTTKKFSFRCSKLILTISQPPKINIVSILSRKRPQLLLSHGALKSCGEYSIWRQC